MSSPSCPSRFLKGRGATYNPDNRFQPTHSTVEDDGWWQEELSPRIATRVQFEAPRSALSWNQSPDLGFDRSLNPYRGCEHGCIYCYARPSHAYWDLSPGIDFETRLIAKTGMVDRLREELCKPGYVCRPINLSGNTDCYQPIEAQHGTTRSLLELLLACRHPVTLVTKSTLILRDRELLAEMARHRLVRVFVSLTSLDNELKRTLEPRTASPAARLKIVRDLHEAGVPVGVLVAPVIPAINDSEIETLLNHAAEAGARTASWTLLRLPREVSPLFEAWLEAHYPDRAGKVMSLIRQSRGGQNNDSRFGHRMRGDGLFVDMIGQRFRRAATRLGLERRADLGLDITQFRAPHAQQDLFN
ncbi:PA0069 family radical SAM protein [Salinicola halimionae]|uniref:PA0069 family radical SAM protein n=1 Tax=Salinicola halimionae TaxID=1949081 RepID=UPI000DA141EF|nr:PA0069 family radical SAM protein [Salinicola halimionae]